MLRSNPDLKLCAKRGHAMYLPSDAPSISADLVASTIFGQAYTCLRCSTYVPDPESVQRLPLDQIPLIPRGSHNRKLYYLRLIAAERWIRAVLMAVVALGLFRLRSSSNHVYTSFIEITKAAAPLATRLGFDTAHSHTIALLASALQYSSSKYVTIASLLLLYCMLQILEGYGLWVGARWGEYLAATATAAFIPLEMYEVATHAAILKITALALNLLILAYLLLTQHLFGIRGGGSYHHQQLLESSLLWQLEKRKSEQLKKRKPQLQS